MTWSSGACVVADQLLGLEELRILADPTVGQAGKTHLASSIGTFGPRLGRLVHDREQAQVLGRDHVEPGLGGLEVAGVGLLPGGASTTCASSARGAA